MYVVLSAFTSSPISLVATKASAFSFKVRLDEQYLPAMYCCNCVAGAWPAMLQPYSERLLYGSAV
jgi:hypothetical protein